MSYTVQNVINGLVQRRVKPLPRPTYSGDSSKGIFLAVESMKRHTTDEGWQIQAAAESAGYTLCGMNLPVNSVNVLEILKLTNPGVVILQDKREWDIPAKSFRDRTARFEEFTDLINWPEIFKLTILKDAHHNLDYHSRSAAEIGCHGWIIYYHPSIVKTLAPYIRVEDCIRTYHSIDSTLVPSFSGNRSKGCLLSGAVSQAYPLRMRLVEELSLLKNTDYLKHPGYHVQGTVTPDYLKLLSKYKVSICTSSMYGFTLRKLIESTACGCVVVTDLPVDDPLPEIDDNLHRISPSASTQEINELVQTLIRTYDPELQQQFAEKAKLYYDYRASGLRLVNDIERMRNRHATLKKG